MAIAGLALAPANAQTQSTTQSTTTSGYIQSSTVVGSKIKDSRGQDVGEIKDFVLDRNTGCLAYVVVSTRGGGTTATTIKTVAAPWSVFSSTSDARVYTTRVERERIYSAPVWESTRVQEYSRPEYMSSVYGYYGVTVPHFNAEVNMSTGNTSTTTGTNTTTGVNASTNATAAPTASLSPPAQSTATAAPTASLSPAAPTASPIAVPSVSPPAANSAVKPLPNTTAPAVSTPKTSTSSSSSSSAEKAPKDMSATHQTKAQTDAASRKSDKATKTESASEKTETTTGDSPSSKTSKKSTKKSTEPEASATPKE